MIEKFSHIEPLHRINPAVAHLNRFGFIWDKENAIDRVFDHISFSFILAGDGFLVRDGLRTDLTAPILMISLPRESKLFRPHSVWMEFFLAYSADLLPALTKTLGKELLGRHLIPIGDMEIIKSMASLIESLSRRDLHNTVPDQLDRIAEAMILAAASDRDLKHVSKQECQVIQFAQYLEANFKHEIDFESLALRLGTSYSSIRKQWSRKFKLSPYAYLMELRMRYADKLLTETYMSIGDIAAECGFQDQRYFSRFFHRMTDSTPSKVRELSRNNNSIK